MCRYRLMKVVGYHVASGMRCPCRYRLCPILRRLRLCMLMYRQWICRWVLLIHRYEAGESADCLWLWCVQCACRFSPHIFCTCFLFLRRIFSVFFVCDFSQFHFVAEILALSFNVNSRVSVLFWQYRAIIFADFCNKFLCCICDINLLLYHQCFQIFFIFLLIYFYFLIG